MVIQRPNVKFFIFAHKMALVVSVNIHSYVPMEQFLIKNTLFVIGGLILIVRRLRDFIASMKKLQLNGKLLLKVRFWIFSFFQVFRLSQRLL